MYKYTVHYGTLSDYMYMYTGYGLTLKNLLGLFSSFFRLLFRLFLLETLNAIFGVGDSSPWETLWNAMSRQYL